MSKESGLRPDGDRVRRYTDRTLLRRMLRVFIALLSPTSPQATMEDNDVGEPALR